MRFAPILLAAAAALVPQRAAHSEPPASRPDIVFISFDTLRRDHVSCYGHETLTTPNVDALAARGVLFTDCQGVVPLTGPSHASLFTGLYPQTHAAFRNGVPLAPSGPKTLAEVLSAAGYRTAAIVSGWTMKARACGLDRGFATYDESGMEERYAVINRMRRASVVTDRALGWADETMKAGEARPPYFLFVHYFDPHEPYNSPERMTLAPNPRADGSPELARHQQQLAAYDQEIAYADAQLGRLLDGLESRGLLRNAVVTFTADHGQSFGDNGYGGPEGHHGRKVYQACLAVPWVLAWPGKVPEGSQSKLETSHLDLAPTLCELAGIPESEWPLGLQGFSLARVLRDPAAVPPWGSAQRQRYGVSFAGAVGHKWNFFSWAQNKKVEQAKPIAACVVVGSTKIVVDPARPDRIEVYDLALDPGEDNPLKDAGDRHASYAKKITQWYERTRAAKLEATAPTGDDLEALRSLGYVE